MEFEPANPSQIIMFFFYGLSFFILGTAISLQSRKGSEFKFGVSLWLLAAYGLIHGSKEWMEMFTMIGRPSWSDQTVEILTITRFFLAMVSFIFLFLFGLGLIVPEKSKKWAFPAAVIFLSFFASVLLILRCLPYSGKSLAQHLDVLVRYGFAFPAIGLAAFALYRQKRAAEIRQLNSASLQYTLTAVAILFGVYAVLDGLFIEHDSIFLASILSYKNFEHVAGFPVQMFRAMCACGILYCILRVLNIFELEKKSKLENACREIIGISTREQERIGQDMHDGLCQELAGILLNGKIAEKQLEKEKSPVAEQVRKMNGLINLAVSHSRTLSKNLYPVEIEEHGLAYALRDYAESVEDRYGLPCRLQLDADNAVKDHLVATHLFRIAQEAVANAVRHGKATVVTVSLRHRTDTVMELSIMDNGSGINVPLSPGSGMGIKIMKYRARVIDGTLEVSRRSEGGTQVVCLFDHGEKKHGKQQQQRI